MDRHGLSERRASELAALHKSVFQYQKQERGDEVLRRRLGELANERRRFGYWRLGILLAREGFEVNHKKLFRLYRKLRKGSAQQALTADQSTERNRNGFYAGTARIRGLDQFGCVEMQRPPHEGCGAEFMSNMLQDEGTLEANFQHVSSHQTL